MSVFALICFKSHHGATKYEGNPWPYWAEMAPLMPSNVKEAHTYLPAQSKPKHTQKKATAPAPAPGLSLAPVPAANSTTGGSNNADVTMKNATPSQTGSTDPNFVTPSTPSMFLSPLSQPVTSTSSSAITSVSQGKCKAASVVNSNARSETASKRSHPLSATMKAQIEGSDAIKRLATVLENMSQGFNPLPPSVPGPSSLPTRSAHSDDYIEQAADILMMFNLSPEQNNIMAGFMSEPANKSKVKFFLKFNELSHKVWIQNVFDEIWERDVRRVQIE